MGGLIILFGCQKPDRPFLVSESFDFKKAETLLYQMKNDSAFYYFDRVATGSKDSLEVAMAYNYMASIQSDAGDYYGAQESLTTSLKFLDERKKHNYNCLASDYNELGMTSSKLKNFDSAIGYFDLALRFSDDKNYLLIILNNKANAYREKGAFMQALVLYQQVLKQKKPEGKGYARLLTNMANAKWLQDPGYDAAPELLKALQIRKFAKDLRGQHSSYAHLADYYSQSKPDSGLIYAHRMYSIAHQLNNPDGQLDALQKLIRLSPAVDAKQYFSRYEQLNDSLQTARNAAKNQFALIRYHTKKNEADNLKLQRDNSEKRYQLIQQSIRFYSTLIVFIFLIIVASLWYKRRKQQSEQEKQDAIRESQRKTSKKVHDTLANDIYRIMKRIQHDVTLDRTWLVDNIDEVYERARDISYEINKTTDDNSFHEKISELLKSFATETTKVILVGNSEELWKKVSGVCKLELKYILQELMVNMQKHSKAENVVIRFDAQAGQHSITYIDDGIGLPTGDFPKNGLTNTGNRINLIGGQITFDSCPGKGLQIQLVFPTA
ncbi:Sensory box histidine kinase [Arcticibacter svalbardensis MN12-7]|uniref:histidine kinase n=2 Tax=Arcticibacter TaxID=1288026 RepID=R9GVB0_9SPHI|nr:Sensory box histidine kinase [Arcticibacter svalbardensis MN12-7]